MRRARIIGTGQHQPEKVLTNQDLEAFMDTTDEWITQRTGIRQRHCAGPGEGPSDLAAPAARAALEAAGVAPEELDLLICCTTTPDYTFPASGCLIQAHIGAMNAAAFDVNAACSGYLYGLSIAQAQIAAGMADTILLVGAEVATRMLNWDKRDTAVLFGDGAGATVLRADHDGYGVLSAFIASDGTGADVLMRKGGGSKVPFTAGNIDSGVGDIQMNGQELFKRAVVHFGAAARKALDDAGIGVDDVALFIPHQANGRIIHAASDRLGLPRDKVFLNLDRVANTTAASIPIALDDAVRAGRLQPGDHVLMASFGAGLTWAAAVIRW